MSAAQIQVILSSPQSFAGLIGQTLSTDNAQRKSAEDLYSSLRKQRPDACATNLLQLLRTSPEVLVRSTCAVFLRKVILSKPAGAGGGWGGGGGRATIYMTARFSRVYVGVRPTYWHEACHQPPG